MPDSSDWKRGEGGRATAVTALRRPHRRSTIRNVAVLAGISTSTASRVLLGHSGSPSQVHLAVAFKDQSKKCGYEVLSTAPDDRPVEANLPSFGVLVDLRTAGSW